MHRWGRLDEERGSRGESKGGGGMIVLLVMDS